jgi:hypothetical protein
LAIHCVAYGPWQLELLGRVRDGGKQYKSRAIHQREDIDEYS